MSGPSPARMMLLPCAAFLVLATTNAVVIPFFEFPDEKNHVHYAQYLARSGALPSMCYVPTDDGETTVRVAFNPPLYYLLASQALDPGTPFISPQVRYAPCGPRAFPHAPRCGWAAFGDLGVRLALLRFVSILFGLVTVVACYGIGRALATDEPSLGAAMAWVPVVIPQFTSMSAAINNEGPAVALASLAILLSVRAARGGRASTAGAAGLLLGAAAMTKISAIVLAPACALAVARGPGRWTRVTALTVAACCVAGPWMARNWVEHRDPTGVRSIEAVEAHRCAGRHPTDLSGIVRGAAVAVGTFFLWYGQLAIHLPPWLYTVPVAATLLAIAGRMLGRYPLKDAAHFVWPAFLGISCLLIAFVLYNLRVYSPQGRYLFVGVGFIAYVLASGALAWSPPARRSSLTLAAGGVFTAAQGVYLLAVVAPAYAR